MLSASCLLTKRFLTNTTVTASAAAASATTKKSTAVVLSGCGVYDGSEIQETVAVLVGLSRRGIAAKVYAPDKLQEHVINHHDGKVMDNETRNILVESSRISRGDAEPLSELHVNEHDAIVFPGGFGAAKNLSNFAFAGVDCKVYDDVENIIKNFHNAGKPMAFCCISPVLAAKVLPDVVLTVGSDNTNDSNWPYAGTASLINDMGGKHKTVSEEGVCVDEQNKIVSAPAYMANSPPHVVADGVTNMIDALIKLM